MFRWFKNLFSTHSKREQWAWCTYDLAKSPFESVLVIFIGPYITYLAQQQACLTQASATCSWCESAGQCLEKYNPYTNSTFSCDSDSCSNSDDAECCLSSDYLYLGHTKIAYSAFFAFAVSASVIIQIFFLPLFGAFGDVYNPKKFLVGSTLAASASLVAFLGTNHAHLFWAAALLYIIANLCYGVANIFYNSMLVYISYPDERDTVSAHGFAVGYSGAILFLIICLLMYLKSQTQTMVTYIIAVCGIWWAIWSMITFLGVRSAVPKEAIGEESTLKPLNNHDENLNIFRRAIRKIVAAVVILKRTPRTALFLVAASIYNDGISTIGSMASVFATEVVHASAADLLISIFILNIMAVVGALFFNQLRQWIKSTKWAILIGIAVYLGIVVFAFFIKQTWEIYMLGGFCGFALGGTQSLSRSLLSVIIPINYESEIFSFYEITQRGTSWMGPIVYGAIVTAYDNNHKPAMLSMGAFLIVGGLLLVCVNVNKAIEQAAMIGTPKGVDTLGKADIAVES